MTTSPSDVTTQADQTGPLDPTDPLRGCDYCGPSTKPLVLTVHGPNQEFTLAWCGHCFTARERMGLLAGAAISDRREYP